MKGYKGFKLNHDGTLQCRDYTFQIGVKHIFEGPINLCESGFHFCNDKTHVLKYYPIEAGIVYYKVEVSGVIIHGDTKSVASEIKVYRDITQELRMFGISNEPIAIGRLSKRQRTFDMKLKAVSLNGSVLQFLSSSERNHVILLTAVKQNGLSIQYITHNERTPDIVLAAVKQNRRVEPYLFPWDKTKEVIKELRK